jgi:hypothetical protein
MAAGGTRSGNKKIAVPANYGTAIFANCNVL